MKSLKAVGLIVLSLVLFNVSLAQDENHENHEIMPYNITFTIAEEFQLYFKDLAEANGFLDLTSNEDTVVEMFAQESYRRVMESIQKQTACNVLPIETLSGKVSYSDFGFPVGNRSKALRKSQAPYYLKLNITLNARNVVDDYVSLNDKNTYQKRTMKAQIILKVRFYGSDGEELFKSKARAKASDWIRSDEFTILGAFTIKGQAEKSEESRIFHVLDEAISNLEINIPAKL